MAELNTVTVNDKDYPLVAFSNTVQEMFVFGVDWNHRLNMLVSEKKLIEAAISKLNEDLQMMVEEEVERIESGKQTYTVETNSSDTFTKE